MVTSMDKFNTKALTPRQIEVLEYLSIGFDDRRISEILRISYSTIKCHIYSDGGIYDRLGIKDSPKNLRVLAASTITVEERTRFLNEHQHQFVSKKIGKCWRCL